MSTLKKIWKEIRGKGRVKNYSSKTLWVVENTSGGPVAHQLKPKFKSPKNIDADGFKRVDGKPIEKHKSWWKILNYTTADVYDQGSGLTIDVVYKRAVPEGQFGKVKYKKGPWGEPIRNVLRVQKDDKGTIQMYYVEGYGWISKSRAVRLATQDKIDNAVPVFPRRGLPYLRSKPDKFSENNFSAME